MVSRGLIKWRKADERLLRDTINKFNRKVRRVRATKPEIASIQPETIRSKDIIPELKNLPRSEFNRIINKYKRYLRRGAEGIYTTKQGVNTTLWQKNEIDIAFRTINRRRNIERKKHEPSTYKGTMGSEKELNLRPRKNTVQSILPKNWNEFVSGIERQVVRENREVRYSQYKANYLKAVENILGVNSPVYKRIESMSAEMVVKAYYTNPILQLSFIYDPIEQSEIEGEILDALDDYESDNEFIDL